MRNYFLQIQPQYVQSEEWAALAQREDLFYEPIEFFFQYVLADPLLLDTVTNWYRDSGRVRSLHGAFIDVNPASGDPAFRTLSRNRCHESCRIAASLGASNLVLHASCFPFLRGAYMDSWAASCAEFYAELAGEYDLTLCIENSQDLDPDPLCALMKRIDDKRVRICLDIGHVNFSNVPVEEWFDRLGEYIAYLHLSDNRGAFDDHLALGDGCIDWKKIDSLWRQLDRVMPITLEVGGISGVEKSLAYLKRNRFFELEE